jgi:NAD(P)-dependent dehydrogenase (short-subunit alcohol dehydrogenase family)
MANDGAVCLVTGVGPGTGAAVARRFAGGGYRVAMLARSADRLAALEAELPGSRAFTCDVGDAGALDRAAGKASFAAFAPTKAAQRILAQSIARDVGPKGVHVGYLVVDAVIDVPWTRHAFAGRPDDFFIQPRVIADEIGHVVHQERSAWSFDVELRPFGETW